MERSEEEGKQNNYEAIVQFVYEVKDYFSDYPNDHIYMNEEWMDDCDKVLEYLKDFDPIKKVEKPSILDLLNSPDIKKISIFLPPKPPKKPRRLDDR